MPRLAQKMLYFLVELAHELRRPIGLQDEKVDELHRRTDFAGDADALADQRDLSDLPAVVVSGEHGGAAAETALIEPLDPFRGKMTFGAGKRLGGNLCGQLVVNRRLFRNRDHGICLAMNSGNNVGVPQQGNFKSNSSLTDRVGRIREVNGISHTHRC
jgi:hypothetical protein